MSFALENLSLENSLVRRAVFEHFPVVHFPMPSRALVIQNIRVHDAHRTAVLQVARREHVEFLAHFVYFFGLWVSPAPESVASATVTVRHFVINQRPLRRPGRFLPVFGVDVYLPEIFTISA